MIVYILAYITIPVVVGIAVALVNIADWKRRR